MAPPPRYLITRNLIRRYFQRILPDKKSIKMDDSRLRSSLLRHGVGSPRVKEVYDEMVMKYKRQEKNAKRFEQNRAQNVV